MVHNLFSKCPRKKTTLTKKKLLPEGKNLQVWKKPTTHTINSNKSTAVTKKNNYGLSESPASGHFPDNARKLLSPTLNICLSVPSHLLRSAVVTTHTDT